MFGGKSNKTPSSSESQTKTTQQQYQQPDLQHLSLVIEQFSSQLNLMLSQQQQQKHSDTGVIGDTADNKQDQPTHFRQQQQVHCPASASRFPPSHSNCCNNVVSSCPKTDNQPHCHSHSTFLSPSLSTLLPSQQLHYTYPCMHGQLHQNYHQHPQLITYGYDAVPPPSCTLPMMCCCQTTAHQCPTTTNNTIVPPANDTTPPSTTIDTTPYDHRQNQKHHYSDTSIPTPTTIPKTLDSCADATCTLPTTHRRFKSRTDPLPPIPNDDSLNDDDDDDGDDNDYGTGNDHKTTLMNGQNKPLTQSLSPPPSHATAAAAAATVTVPNCDVSCPNTQEQQDGQISWTDLYRQDILAKQDTLASSYNNISSSVFNNDTNSNKKKEYKSKSGRSHLRGWWSHGKYKWKQLRKKSVSPLSAPG